MLSFVGLGISGFESIPIEGLEIISNADIVYLENFTRHLDRLKILTGRTKPLINAVFWGKHYDVRRWRRLY